MTDKAFKIYNRIRLVALIILAVIIIYCINIPENKNGKDINNVDGTEVIEESKE